MRFTRRARLAFSLVLALVVTASAAIAADGSVKRASGGTITAGVLHAFTGPTAFFGSNASVACKAAASQINAGGGVLGNKLECKNFDTKGDPADAVPTTSRMLATTGGLVMVVGPDGNDIPAVLPLFDQSKMAEMNTVGDPRYDHQTSAYFWRLTPSDSTQGPALAYYAKSIRHYSRIAEVFTSDLSNQTTVVPFRKRYAKLGGKEAIKLSLTAGQASYKTEVARLIAAKPQAIVGDLDPRTATTFLSELQQQNGKLIPFIGGQQSVQGEWTDAVVPAVGAANVHKYISAVSPDLSANGVGFVTFAKAAAAAGANGFQKSNAFVAATYDGVIAFALAMNVANSTKPSDYVSKIAAITSPKKGGVVVHTYKAALAALKKGEKFQFKGASGALIFDKWHTANRGYVAQSYGAKSQSWTNSATIPRIATLP